MDIDLSALEDEPLEIPHDFEIELNCVVIANLKFTLEGIDREEENSLEGFTGESQETYNSILNHIGTFYDDLRLAARRLAAVALVTRFHHWVEKFAKKRNLALEKGKKSRLMKQLEALEREFGMGPVSKTFFENLANVRDSVIHGDSKAEWYYDGAMRSIASEYRNDYGEAELTDEQLQVAIENCKKQIIWLDERLSN